VDDALTTIDCDYLGAGFACAYLRVQGDDCAFIETNTTHAVPKLLAALDARGIDRARVRYVIVTHVHLDHAGGASALMRALPNATLLAHPRAARHVIDPSRIVAGATAVYGAARFAELYGVIEGLDAARVRAMDDGAEAPFGDGALRFVHTRGHANHHMVVHDPQRDTVFTGDAFGLAYPRLQRGNAFIFPSTSPTDFDGPAAHESVDRIVALGTASVCLTHFGEHRSPASLAPQLHAWLSRAESLVAEARGMEVAAREPFLAARLTESYERETAAAGITLDDGDRALLALDIELNAQGLAVAAARA
jgi:glyoxylase-like metal-dependent hydrolase (beta-lactamase superfamily II)